MGSSISLLHSPSWDAPNVASREPSHNERSAFEANTLSTHSTRDKIENCTKALKSTAINPAFFKRAQKHIHQVKLTQAAATKQTSGFTELEKVESKATPHHRLITGKRITYLALGASFTSTVLFLVKKFSFQVASTFLLSPVILGYRAYDLQQHIKASLKHPKDYANHYTTVYKTTMTCASALSTLEKIEKVSKIALKTAALSTLHTVFAALSGMLLVGTITKLRLQSTIIQEIKSAKTKDDLLEIIKDHPQILKYTLFESIRLCATDTEYDLKTRLSTMLENHFDNTKNFITKEVNLLQTATKVDIAVNSLFVMSSLIGLVNPIVSLAAIVGAIAILAIKELVVLPLSRQDRDAAKAALMDKYALRVKGRHHGPTQAKENVASVSPAVALK